MIDTSQDKGGAKPGVEDAVASATWRILSLPSKLTSAKVEEQIAAEYAWTLGELKKRGLAE